MSTDAPKFKVGDTVILSIRHQSELETTITRVGRKYAYIEQYGRERAFDLWSGYEANNKYGTPGRIRTPGMVAEEARRKAVIDAIRGHGITYDRYIGFKQSTDVLEQILRVLEETA